MRLDDNLQVLFVAVCAGALILMGIWHILQGDATERMFRNPRNVRILGAMLLLVCVPCFLWSSPYFLILGTIVGLSGILRLFAPNLSIAWQKKAYPRWVHGCIMIVAGVAIWLIYHLLSRGVKLQ